MSIVLKGVRAIYGRRKKKQKFILDRNSWARNDMVIVAWIEEVIIRALLWYVERKRLLILYVVCPENDVAILYVSKTRHAAFL